MKKYLILLPVLLLFLVSFSCAKKDTPTEPSSPLPKIPSNLQPAVAGASQIDLSWADNSSNEDGFKIERKAGRTGTYTEISTTGPGVTAYSDTGLSAGILYFYKIRAYNSFGNSTYATEASATMQVGVTTLGDMVLIPAGSFQMGDSYHEENSGEVPVHTVNTDDYYIDKYEVTFDKYDAFCIATGRTMASDQSAGRGARPVIRVTWLDAVAYCNWRSEQEGKEKCYDSGYNLDRTKKGYRLPTEAEWERAARGGLSGKRYPWGDSIDSSKANFSGSFTVPVGSYPANGYGLFDMAGNVYEWCGDWYDGGYYGSSPAFNPTGPVIGTYRILRGGSWSNPEYGMRCAGRATSEPADLLSNCGIRCVMTK